jgi:hypothetical protein
VGFVATRYFVVKLVVGHWCPGQARGAGTAWPSTLILWQCCYPQALPRSFLISQAIATTHLSTSRYVLVKHGSIPTPAAGEGQGTLGWATLPPPWPGGTPCCAIYVPSLHV